MWELTWELHYAALLEYGKQYGHCNIPSGDSYACILPVSDAVKAGDGNGDGDGMSELKYSGFLGKWLMIQGMLKGQEKLDVAHESLLQALVDRGINHVDGVGSIDIKPYI